MSMYDAYMQPGNRGIEIISHRGGALRDDVLPMKAFARAIDDGADRLECDVRRSSDGMLYIRHDPRVGKKLASLKYSGIVAELGAEQVPRLEDLFHLAKGRVRLILHLKERGIARAALELARQYVELSDTLVISFRAIDLVEAKMAFQTVTTGLIVGRRVRSGVRAYASEFFPRLRARRAGVDMLVCKERLMGRLTRPLMLRPGLPIIVWSVNTEAGLRRYLDDPVVVGILTDDVALGLKMRAEVVRRPR